MDKQQHNKLREMRRTRRTLSAAARLNSALFLCKDHLTPWAWRACAAQPPSEGCGGTLSHFEVTETCFYFFGSSFSDPPLGGRDACSCGLRRGGEPKLCPPSCEGRYAVRENKLLACLRQAVRTNNFFAASRPSTRTYQETWHTPWGQLSWTQGSEFRSEFLAGSKVRGSNHRFFAAGKPTTDSLLQVDQHLSLSYHDGSFISERTVASWLIRLTLTGKQVPMRIRRNWHPLRPVGLKNWPDGGVVPGSDF